MKGMVLWHGILGGVLGMLSGSVALAADVWEGHESGFLGDASVYEKLEVVEIRSGVKAKRWIGPAMNFSNYKAIVIDDVVLYPESEPNEQVSAETLEQISQYVSRKLREKVATVLTVVDAPGPEVLRMQAALTGVAIETEGMQAYEVLPVTAAFGLLKAATGTREMDVHVFFEGRFVDSQTGELVGAAMRRVPGKQLEGASDHLELEDMQGSLDEAAEYFPANLSGMLGKPVE